MHTDPQKEGESVSHEDIEKVKQPEVEEPKKESQAMKRLKGVLKGDRRKTLGVAVLLILIFVLAFSVRATPARFNEIQALDPFYLYRLGQHMIDNNFQLPELDEFRHHPFGSVPLQDEFSVPIYLPVTLYVLIGGGMPFLQFAILYPALMGALAIFVMFFIGRELYDYRAGLFSAFFLAVIPAFITRTSAGFFDKEPTFGFFMLLTVLFFIAAYKRESWKLGILGGVFLGISNISSGIGVYMYIFFFLFAIILLLINRYKGLMYSYAPAVVLSIIIQLLAPKSNIDSLFIIITGGVFGLLIVTYIVDRFRVVKEKDMKFFVPGLLVLVVVGLLIGTIFSDYLFQLINGLVSVVFVLNPSPIGYTVAEQQPGDLNALMGLSDLHFSNSILPQLSFITPFLSIWLFMFLGILAMLYHLFKKRDLTMILPLVWLTASIWGIFLFIRLSFLFGPPAALMAGLFIAWGLNKLELAKTVERLQSIARYVPYYIVIIAVLIAIPNAVNAYEYTHNLGPSICVANEQVLIGGAVVQDFLGRGRLVGRCLDVNPADGSITYAPNQPWYQAMEFLRTLPEPKNVLTWWDFGHWFHARGETPSVSDGGKGPRFPTAQWYTASVDRWEEFLPFTQETYEVTHILQDHTLPGKYGAITAIATDGQGTVGLLQLGQGQTFTEGNTTIQEFTGGGFVVWLPLTPEGNLAGSPRLLTVQGDQFVNNGFINSVCTVEGIVQTGDEQPSIGGCLSISSYGVFYLPEGTHNSIFASLQFMDGFGLPVEKVFDNQFIKIYEVQY